MGVSCEWQPTQSWADASGLPIEVFDDRVSQAGPTYAVECGGVIWMNQTLAQLIIDIT